MTASPWHGWSVGPDGDQLYVGPVAGRVSTALYVRKRVAWTDSAGRRHAAGDAVPLAYFPEPGKAREALAWLDHAMGARGGTEAA